MTALSVKGFLTGSVIHHRLQNRCALKCRLKAREIVRFFDPLNRFYSLLHCDETRIANICEQISCKRMVNITLYKRYIRIAFLHNDRQTLRRHIIDLLYD